MYDEVLIEQRRPALLGVEEDAVEAAVDLEHRQRRDHQRPDHQQHVPDHGRRPGERRHAPPGQPRGAQRAHRGDEVDREADEPEGREGGSRDPRVGAVGGREGEVGERWQGRRAGLRRGVEEAPEERHPARQVEVVRELVEARQRHPPRSDLQRHDVADHTQRQGHAGEDDEGHGRRAHQAVEDLRLDQRVLREHQLQAHEEKLRRREGEESERGGDVEQRDDLVIGAGGALDPRLARRPQVARDDLGTGFGRVAGGWRHPASSSPCAASTAPWALLSSAPRVST